MAILKHILLAIVVLPVSFIAVCFLTAILFGFGAGLFDVMHLDATELFHDPTNFAQKAQVAWQDMQSQYATDPAFFSKTGDAFQVSIKKHATTVENLAAIYAAVGALIFFLSCLGNTMYVSLLTSRRIITVPLVFSYAFIISLAIIYVVVDYLCLAIVRTASVPGAQVKNVADFHTNYDVDVIAGTTLVALIFAIYFSYRLIRWDGLPWCHNPLPVQPRSRAKPVR